MMGNTSLALLLAIFICSIPHSSFSQQHCRNPPIIFNLGDSNSDTGRLSLRVNLPYGRAYFGKVTGRFSDGRLIIDFLCQSLNRTLLRPYVDLLFGPFSNGANFAVAGSATMPRNVPFSLNIQVMEFNLSKDRLSALAAAAGIRNFIGDNGFRNALYMIDIGQNDLSHLFKRGLSYAQVIQNIPSVLEEIKNAVKEIYDLKGRKFWIHNTGPLGCLPQKLALVKNISHDMDSIGCISSYNAAAKVFNKGLYQLTETLRSEMKDAVIVYMDIYAIKLDLIANATKYGFSSPLMACCGFGGPPYNYDPRVLCGFPGYNVCDPSSRFVSWDGVHYTEAANAFVTSKILSTNYSTPKLAFDFFCRLY